MASCFYCGRRKGCTIDHVIPKAALRASWVKLTQEQNAINRVSCCPACNARKGSMHPLEWANVLKGDKKERFDQRLALLPVTAIYAESLSRAHWLNPSPPTS